MKIAKYFLITLVLGSSLAGVLIKGASYNDKQKVESTSVSPTIIPTQAESINPQKNVYIQPTVVPTGVQTQPTQIKSQTRIYQASNEPIKIRCSYNDGKYNFDYGMQTVDNCKSLSNSYWARIRSQSPTSVSVNYYPSNPQQFPQVKPIDGTIYMDPKPTSSVPYGFSN